jgi:hypothetical protein
MGHATMGDAAQVQKVYTPTDGVGRHLSDILATRIWSAKPTISALKAPIFSEKVGDLDANFKRRNAR